MDYTDANYQPFNNNTQQTPDNNQQQTTHDVPKCNCCGHIGPWKEDPVFRPVDWILTVFFLLLGIFPGIIYAVVVLAIRSGKHGDGYRNKRCTNCGAKNLFTFIY